MKRSVFIWTLSMAAISTLPLNVQAETIDLPEVDPSALSQIDSEPEVSGYITNDTGIPLTADGFQTDSLEKSPKLKQLIDQASAPITAEDSSAYSPALTIIPASVPPQYNFTGCNPFVLGNGTSFNLNSAQQTCSNTYSPTPIKLESVILNQSSGTDYDLLVYFYNHDTSQVELVGGSVNDGSADERFSYVMPAGNYLLYALPQATGTTISYVVGALGWANYDDHEANEDLTQATLANGGNYAITGNADNSNDRDVFLYTAASTQDTVRVRLDSNVHTLQVLSGSSWVDVNQTGEFISLVLPNPGDSVYLRVRPTVGTTVDPLVYYGLVMTNPSARLDSESITGDVQPGWFPGTEINTDVAFTGVVVDQFDNAVPYADDIEFRVTSEDGVFIETAEADASGYFNHTVSIPDCSIPGAIERRWDYANEVCWEVEYHYDSNHTWTFGISGDLGIPVQYHHVCDADLLSGVSFSACQ